MLREENRRKRINWKTEKRKKNRIKKQEIKERKTNIPTYTIEKEVKLGEKDWRKHRNWRENYRRGREVIVHTGENRKPHTCVLNGEKMLEEQNRKRVFI